MSVNNKLRAVAEEYCHGLLEGDVSTEGVFLVGSVARGEAVEGSDVDLLIIDNRIHLNSDQQDNMRELVYKEEMISLIRTNLLKLEKNIKEGITTDICFAKEAIPLFDPKNLISKIKKLTNNFSFEVNLTSRIDNAIFGLKDAERFLRRREEEKAKMIALTTSLFLMRGFIQYHNSPYTSTKQIFGELQKYDPLVADSFKKIWSLNTCESLLKELSFQINRIKAIANKRVVRS